ncbi:hypothetical protein AAC387_Pa12g1699 [Persea americana]
MAVTHKILLCYSILLLLAVLARSNKLLHTSMPSFHDTRELIAAPDLDHIDAHEPLPPNDGYDRLKIPPPQYHIDNEPPPSKLNTDAHVSQPRHNDGHVSTALPDHDDNDGYQGMLPNHDTGAESAAKCYGLCSKIPGPCSSFCIGKGYSGGTCIAKIEYRHPIRLCCCCFSK